VKEVYTLEICGRRTREMVGFKYYSRAFWKDLKVLKVERIGASSLVFAGFSSPFNEL
jgi:hypothetical protein